MKATTRQYRFFRSRIPIQDPTVTIFMWGVGYSLRQLSSLKVHTVLVKQDFKSRFRVKVRNSYTNSESLPERFVFKEYSPQVFRNIRSRFQIDEEFYRDALTFDRPIRDLTSKGRSGAIFLRSYNDYLLIKLIPQKEAKTLLKILNHYYEHLVDAKMDTLLPPLFGLYQVTCKCSRTDTFPTGKKFLLVLLHVAPKAKMVFDLKGVALHRQATSKERMASTPVLKDLDFIEGESRIKVGEEEKEKLMKTLGNDVKFLTQNNLFDYSLLVCLSINSSTFNRQETDATSLGYHNQSSEGDEEQRDRSDEDQSDFSFPSSIYWHDKTIHTVTPTHLLHSRRVLQRRMDSLVSTPEVQYKCHSDIRMYYHFSVIDILTTYDWRKKVIKFLKTLRYGRHVSMSTAEPAVYGTRFIEFLDDSIH